jgi:tRNA (cmo5U34)-methyltransferase
MTFQEHPAERLFTGPIAAEYEMLKRICPAAADMSHRVGKFVGGWLPPAAVEILRILEIGTGTGVTTLCLLASRSDLHITGIDNEPAMLAQARRNLATELEEGRLVLLENDALSYLAGIPDGTLDVVASAYTLHNFLDGYRGRVLAEIFRVLKPGGVFVNGDRYGLDDPREHLALIQAEARDYFRTFRSLGRWDLLEHWILHLLGDESAAHAMCLEPSLGRMRAIGFEAVILHYRAGVNALVTGVRP